MARLFVGNLPWKATEDDLKNFFASFNPLEVKIITEKETGRSRGFAFVSVESEIDDVISTCDGRELLGRSLRVSEAQQKK